MKNIQRILILFLSLTLVLAIGCKKEKSNQAEVNTKENSTDATKEDDSTKEKHAYESFVELGAYTGIEIQINEDDYILTDEEFNKKYETLIGTYGENVKKTEGIVKDGDNINLDYSGILDGVAFEGGTATNQSYEVGSNRFIDDLDEGLKGIEIGKEVDIPCTFPSNYHSADLAGKNVIFKVTVNYVTEIVLPEETDELAKKIAEDNGITDKFNTIVGLKEYFRNRLEEAKEEEFNSAKFEAAFKQILDKCVFNGMPEDEYNDALSNVKRSIEDEFEIYKAYKGYTWEQYLQANNMTQEGYETYCAQTAEEYIKSKMVITLIAVKEGISVSEEEINENLLFYATQYGYETVEQLMANVQDEYKENYKAEKAYEVLYNKVFEFIVKNCKVV